MADPDYAAYFLGSRSDVAQLETLEISHPSFSKTYYVVRNKTDGLVAQDEDGVSRTFDYYPLRIRPQGARDNLDFGISVDLGDLGEVIPMEIDNVLNGGPPPPPSPLVGVGSFSTTPSIPAGTQAGQVLVLLGGNTTQTPPAGWQFLPGGYVNTLGYWKRATGSDVSPTLPYEARISAWRASSATDPWEAYAPKASTVNTATPPAAQSISTLTPGSIVMFLACAYAERWFGGAAAAVLGSPTGIASIPVHVDSVLSANQEEAFASGLWYAVAPQPGATGTETPHTTSFAFDVAAGIDALLLALKPEGS